MNAIRFAASFPHPATVLSRAACLFVDPPKGPVLLNYGIEELPPSLPAVRLATILTMVKKLDQN